MRRSPSRILLLAGVAALAAAIPALGQDSPESLLPPGFDDPPPPPKEEPRPEPRPDQPGPSTTPEPAPGDAPSPAPAPAETDRITDSAEEDLRELRRAPPTYNFDVPAAARRPTDVVGVLDSGNWGLPADAFGDGSGAYLATLMRQLDAPLPSRWASMLLRRALMTRVAAPAAVDPVDWVAERAALLLRMGEADAARALVQAIDVSSFTPQMIQVALDTALATADPAALCPIIGPGRALGDQPVWRMADAICAALAGEAARAGALVDDVRRQGAATGADLLLAEKVIGAGTDTRRAVTMRWDDVDRLTPWRFGLAGATGTEIPERLIGAADRRMQAWFARAPMVPAEQRVAAAFVAAELGVFSSGALVELHSLVFEDADPERVNEMPAGRLRIAYANRDPADRMRALRDLWDEGDDDVGRYGRHILTAGAAARIPVAADFAEYADDLLAAMLSAGLAAQAERWTDSVAGGDAGEQAWALLAVGAARPRVDLSAASVESYRDGDDSPGDRRTRILVAALAGLDRLGASEAAQIAADLGFDLGQEDRWTRALDAAAAARHQGSVALLAAVGLQTSDWTGVPPSHFYRIVRALRLAGLEFEARMMAAEALTRL